VRSSVAVLLSCDKW